jgi:hypothetical protein
METMYQALHGQKIRRHTGNIVRVVRINIRTIFIPMEQVRVVPADAARRIPTLPLRLGRRVLPLIGKFVLSAVVRISFHMVRMYMEPALAVPAAADIPIRTLLLPLGQQTRPRIGRTVQ